MNPYIAAAIASVVAFILKLHLTVNAAGVTVTVSLPVAIVVILGAAITVGLYLIVRSVTGFRILGGTA